MKKIRKLLNEKRWRWTAGGVLCLVVASMIFALGSGVGASAENLRIGNYDFSQDEDGKYVIDSAEKMIALGNATTDTSGVFKLTKDIVINVTKQATGTFTGTFDGNGHVVTIASVSELTSTGTGAVSEGLLFGTVSGKVQNLIVDIQKDVMYTRTSTVGVSDTGEAKTEVTKAADAPYSGTEEFSSFSSDNDAKSLANKFNEVSFPAADIIAGDNGKTYYRVKETENIQTTTTYELNAPETDQFGIICGTLESGASIEQVYVKGTGVLNVKQYAGKVSNTSVQSGTRDKYFYYEKGTGSYVETVTPSGVTANAPLVSIYNSNINVSDGSANDVNGVKIEVSAPKYAAKGKALVYSVQVTNGNASEIGLTGIEANIGSTSDSNGTWTTSNGDEVTWASETLERDASKTYNYTISSVSGEIPTKFTLNYGYSVEAEGGNGEETVNETRNGTLATPGALDITVVDTVTAGTSSPAGSGLEVTFSPEKINYLADGTVDVIYTLTLANNIEVLTDDVTTSLTIKAEDIEFNLDNASQSVSWTQNGQSFSEVTIAEGGKTSIKGTLTLDGPDDKTSYSASVTVSPSAQENTYTGITTYKYVSDVPASLKQYGGPNYGAAVAGPADNTTGNHLNAGIIAGTSKGSITNTKQDMKINGSSYDGNTAELNTGGIVGAEKESASASNLYILGTQNYSGENSSLPTDSIVAGGAKPNNTNWTSYVKYESTGNRTEAFDLKWLVEEDSDQFTYSEPSENGEIAIAILSEHKKTSKDLDYIVAYNARKSMSDTSEDTVYVSTGESMELGESGYYRLLSTYATDGYYHYTTPAAALDAADFVYPYDSSAPYEFTAEVIRTKNPLDDKVVITFKDSGSANTAITGKAYYEINSTAIPTSESEQVDINSGIANIPFEISPSSYKITPVIGGYIYPSIETDKFDNRDPLPAPSVMCFNYYDSKGDKKSYIAFDSDKSYEAGSDMMIVPANDEGNSAEYTLKYKFADTLLGGENSWDTSNNMYTGTSNIMSNALEYSDSAVIPDNLAGKSAYLYVEVSKKNYDPTIYYYGPFSVVDKAELVETLNGTPVGETDEEHRVLNDDVVKLTVNAPEGVTYEGIQYMVSTVPTASYSWRAYDDNTGIILSESAGGYIYARIEYEKGSKYGEPQLFDFIFGTACGSPIITPNTGLSTSGEGAAATIEPTTLIGLSSRTAGASIFYVKSEQPESIEMERTTAPTNLPEDKIQNDYKYFNIENRWYRTKNTSAEPYATGLNLSHSENEPKYMYVTAVAIADGYDISDELTFIYKVQPPQQVKNPEAAFETRFTPGGEEVETSTVSMGGKLSFYSVTPGATLYYALGTDGGEWSEIPEDGVTVEGNYGGNFVVRVQAKKYDDPASTEKVETMLPSEIITFVYKIADQELANAPTATPGTSADVPTTVIPGNKILLSTTTKGAVIFYTTDGTTPQVEEVEVTNEDGTTSKGYQAIEGSTTKEYDSSEGIEMPLDGSDYFTITAVAFKTGLEKSPEARFTYVYPDAVLAPYANIDSGKVELNTQVLLKNLTEGAVIYYNVAYGSDAKEEDVADPTLSSTVFSEEYPFTITQKTIIKAMAAKDGVKSSIATFTYDPMVQLAAPTASIETGSVVSNGTVLQLIAAKGATIYYTIDGSDPTDAANTAVMSGNSVTLNGEPGGQVTIKAYAKAADSSQSEAATFTYQFSQNTLGGVTANIATGSTVSNGTKVILMSDVTGAEIYYTTDGDSPIEHGTKGTTVEIDGTPGTSFTIKAVAKVDDVPGIVTTFIYKIKEKPSAPTASPAGGTLTVATRVSLDSSEGKIYYTTDGTDPTKSSNLYSEPILINRTTTLKAIAVSEDGEVSDVATFQYMAAPKAGMPKADQESGSVLKPGTKVTLWSDTKNAEIYYTTDGTDPTINNLDDLLVYDSDGIEINRSVTIKAVAYVGEMQISNVSTWNYIVETIPAVETKKAEAAKLAEEGLRDTDATELARKNEQEEADGGRRVLKERECNTMLISARENIADNAVLYTEEKEINKMAVRNAKTLFGDDYTILSEYDIHLKSGKTYVQPKGEVEIALPIPDGYENATLTVVNINSKNKLTTLETKREDGMLYATVTALNEFAVVGLENPDESSRTFPYLLLLEIAAGAILLIGIIYYAREKWKKYKKRK